MTPPRGVAAVGTNANLDGPATAYFPGTELLGGHLTRTGQACD